jgi:hypothetical protein
MAGFDPITAGEQLINTVLGRVLPDKAAKDAAVAQLAQLKETGDLELMMGQLNIDLVEAGSTNWWENAARPAILWVCAAALATDFVFRPYAMWLWPARAAGFPVLDMTELWPLMSALLGLGAQHAWQKVQEAKAGS